ncbi:MAG: hypothetical protein JW700_03480 [Candidatus Aenigmarchaeota archaeon]|nr:hypothetical protein [Candidatus Aenigmarchaeota archaeon]
MTYGWAILIILIVAGVLAYYGIFSPSSFLGPTARGFGQVQVLNPWALAASDGSITLNLANRVGGEINVTNIDFTVGSVNVDCDLDAATSEGIIASGADTVVSCTPASGWTALTTGDTYSATVVISYAYPSGPTAQFSSAGTITGTLS